MLLVKYFFYQKFLENYCFLNNINRANVRQDRCSQTMVRGPLVARFLWKNWIFISFLSYFFLSAWANAELPKHLCKPVRFGL